MKRRIYLFPLMAATALSLSLGACDDNTAEDAAADQTSLTAPATLEAEITPEEVTAAVIHADNATAFATAEGATNGAVFLTLHNPQTVVDKLIGAKTSVPATVELHENVVSSEGTMQMRKVDAIEIQPGQQVILNPEGHHIMLMGLTAPLVAGETFTVTLDFENAADIAVPVTIVTAGNAAAADHSGHEHDTPATEDTSGVTPTDEPMATETTTTPAPADATTTAPAVDEQPAP